MYLTSTSWQDPGRLIRTSGLLVVAGAVLVLVVRVMPVPELVSYVAFATMLTAAPALALLSAFAAWIDPSPRTFAVSAAACMLVLPLAGLSAQPGLPTAITVAATVSVVPAVIVALSTIVATAIAGLGRLAIAIVDHGLVRKGKPTVAQASANWLEQASSTARISAVAIVVTVMWVCAARVLRAIPVEDSGVSRIASSAILDLMTTGETFFVGVAGAGAFVLAVDWMRSEEVGAQGSIEPVGRRNVGKPRRKKGGREHSSKR